MKTLLKTIRTGAVVLAMVGIVSPPAVWAGGFKTGHVASHAQSPSRPSATGGAGAGKIKFKEFTVKKTTDSASPAFFKTCVKGEHYKKVVIEMRKAGGDPQSAGKPFLQYKFDTVFTTKVAPSGPGAFDSGHNRNANLTSQKQILGGGKQGPSQYAMKVDRSGPSFGGATVSQPKAASLVRRGGPGTGGVAIPPKPIPPKPIPATMVEYGMLVGLIAVICL
jgi:type VI protein secretion system component Hcp